MNDKIEEIRKQLLELQDLKYRDFNTKLIPTVDPETVIGVRTPVLRNLAKELARSSANWQAEIEPFFTDLPHKYFEENNLHGFLIEKIKDYNEAMDKLEKFLPYVDNWATCDITSPKVFKKHLSELYKKILVWIKSDNTYTVRYSIGMLMSYYLDDNFEPGMLKLVADVESEEYYINMMRAWYFATAFAKQREAALQYFENKRMDKWTHNKAIQKCVESYRVSDEDKQYLRTLKVK